MSILRCNPYIDTPLTISRVLLMALSTFVFVSEVIYGTIRGFIWFGTGRKCKNEETYLKFRKLMQYYFRLDMRLHPWLSCEITNHHQEKFRKGAIAVCNHQSLLDTLCLLLVSPNIVIVANRKVINNPLVKILLHYAEFTCVDSTVDGLKDYCRYHSDRGHTIVIFPEGQRSEKCDIKRFHVGAFLLADELNLDIIPIFFHGSGYVLPLHKAFQNNAKMYIEIGKRISPKDRMNVGVRMQARKMRQSYQIKYAEICKRQETAHFFHSMLINLFRVVNKSAKVKRLLKEYDDFSFFIDREYQDGSKYYIDDKTYGLFPLLFALVHPNIWIYLCADAPLRLLYSKCTNLPQNIIWGLHENSNDDSDDICKIDNIVNIKIVK